MIKKAWRVVFPPVSFVLLFLLIWEGVVRIWQIEEWILPAPSAIVHAFLTTEDIGADLLATLYIALLGLAIGTVIGFFFAAIAQLIPWCRRAIYPLLLLSQNVPMIALAPLLVAWFGFGDWPKLVVVALVCFFPITVATLDGFAQVDPDLYRYVKISGFTRWQIFWYLEVPSSRASFFSGFKLSTTYSVMGAVIAEWLGAEHGIGQLIKIAGSSFQVVQVFVAIIWVVILSLSLFAIVQLLERWLVYKGGKKG